MMQNVGITQHGRLAGAALGSILAVAGLTLAATPGYATTIVHDGSAYGAEVLAGSVVKLGKVAIAQFPSCSVQATGSFTASVASTGLSPLFTTGLVDSTATSTANSSISTAEVLGVNLLGGLITTSDVKSVSTSSISPTGVPSFSSAGTTFASLKVLGLPIAANVAPNTEIDLPGIGTVILNKQTSTLTSDEGKLEIVAIDIHVTIANLFGYAKGTEIKIADASSEVRTAKGPAIVGGYAESPQLVVGPVSSGPLVDQLVPCLGSYGATETDQVAAANLPGVLTTGAVTASETSSTGKSESYVTTTTKIAGANLLNGVLGATAITGTASGTTTNGESFDFTAGSTFVGLSVLGHPEITDTVAPNTTINLAGLGTLYLNRIVKNKDYIKAVPVLLIVNTENTLGLPIGAQLTLGVSKSELHSASIP